MRIRYAIWDFDGTLFDSMPIWKNLGYNYLLSIGKTPRPSVGETIKDMSLEQSALYFQEEYEVSLSVEAIIKGITKIIEDEYLYKISPKEGVAEFLEEMESRGILMFICTASDRRLVEAALKRCDMDCRFSGIITCSEIGMGKNNPMIFERAAEFLRIDKEDTLIFEDAFHAIKSAKSGGFKTVAVYDESNGCLEGDGDCSREDESFGKEDGLQEKIRNMSDFYIKDFNEADEFWKFAEMKF